MRWLRWITDDRTLIGFQFFLSIAMGYMAIVSTQPAQIMINGSFFGYFLAWGLRSLIDYRRHRRIRAAAGSHVYPSHYGPDHPAWFVRSSWAILDQVPPGAMPDPIRFLLGGLLAAALAETYKIGQEGSDPNHPPQPTLQ